MKSVFEWIWLVELIMGVAIWCSNKSDWVSGSGSVAIWELNKCNTNFQGSIFPIKFMAQVA